jgi:ABC-type nitrate/sulfonate/bicarbonate transport system permease component
MNCSMPYSGAPMRAISKAIDLLPGVAFIAMVILALQRLVDSGVINRVLFPPPSVIASTVVDLIQDGEVIGPLGETISLFAVGYTLSTLVGIALGLMMGSSQTANHLLDPLIESIRPLPKVALVPVLMLFLGLGATMKVTSVVLASFFPILINTIQGVRGVDPVLIATGRTFGLSRFAITMKIILPASIPYLLAGMRVALGLALLMTILSEMLAGTGGLGYLVLENQRAFHIRQMYAWLVILAIVGLAINAVMNVAERRLAPWLEKHRVN